MRIAILTSARSGSTSLYHLIEKHLLPQKYICISEPFNNFWRDKIGLPTYDTDFFVDKENIFVKTFVSKNQKPKSLEDNEDEYWKWFFGYFDKVILLNRLNKDLQSESLTFHMKSNDIHSWQKKQFYDLSNISKEEIENSKQVLIKEFETLNWVYKMGYPMFDFEDIFIKKDKSVVEEIFSYINVDLKNPLYESIIKSDLYRVRVGSGEERFKGLI